MNGKFLVPLALVVLVVSGCAPSLLPGESRVQYTPGEFCPTESDEARELTADALVLEARGKIEEAKELYLKAIDLDSEYCDAMDNLGLLLRGQGDVEEAIQWYKRSIEILPDNTAAHMNLAVAYKVQGQYSNAMAEFEILVEIAPDDPEGYYGVGSVYLELDQPQEALASLKKAEELYKEQSSPWLVDAQYHLGYAHEALEEFEKAKDYYELVYPSMRESPEINYFLGLYYLQIEVDLDLAEKYLEKAKELGVEIPPGVRPRLGD